MAPGFLYEEVPRAVHLVLEISIGESRRLDSPDRRPLCAANFLDFVKGTLTAVRKIAAVLVSFCDEMWFVQFFCLV
jgi:hypothetical protein